jgi:predicted transcriptional regulator
VQLILTKNAFEKIKKEYAEILLSGLQYTNARLWVYKKDLRFSSIITDNFLSLGLFSENEIFDSKRDLVSSDPSSVKWGEDLFAYYMNKSSRVNREGRY